MATQQAISAVLNNERVIHYGAAVTDASGPDWVYFVIGDKNIHLLDSELKGDAEGGLHLQYSLLNVERISKHETDPDSVIVHFTEERVSTLLVTARGSRVLATELRIAGKTAKMSKAYKVLDVQMETDAATSAGVQRDSVTTFVRAPTNERRHLYLKYMFFLPDTFSAYPPASQVESGSYSAATRKQQREDRTVWQKYEFVDFNMSGVVPVQIKDSEQNSAPFDIAQQAVKRLGANVDSYRTILSRAYIKRLNLTADPAQWTGWLTVIRTGEPTVGENAFYSRRDIAVVALQRYYMPPSMATCQDIVCTYFGSQTERLPLDDFIEKVSSVADSVSPMFNEDVDFAVAQARANALQLTPQGFSWFRNRLRIVPSVQPAAQRFVKRVIEIFVDSRLFFTDTSKLFPELETRSEHDPLYYASLLERDIPGLSDRITEDTLMRWRRRVWRYLGWALDGGIVSPSTFSMSAMIQAMHSLPSGSKTRLVGERVLDSVLHLKRPGKPYVWTPLMQQVVDVELMQDFELNDAAMVTMLSNNYIRDQLESDPVQYPRFLARLLRRPRSYHGSARVARQVCKQLVQLSTSGVRSLTPAQLEPLLITVVPAIVDALKAVNEDIRAMAAAALVGFAANNMVIKDRIMAVGGIRQAIRQLGSRHADLVRHCCTLIEICTKADDKQRAVSAMGAIPRLISIVRKDVLEPYYAQAEVLVQAVGALKNLAAEDTVRSTITAALGYAEEKDAGGAYLVPKLVQHLISMLRDPDLCPKDMRSAVEEKIIGLLGNLCKKDVEAKRAVTRVGARDLTQRLEAAMPLGVLTATLGAVALLTKMRANVIVLNEYNVLAKLAALRGQHLGKVVDKLVTEIEASIAAAFRTLDDDDDDDDAKAK